MVEGLNSKFGMRKKIFIKNECKISFLDVAVLSENLGYMIS